jgi:hypothetical protein
MLPRDKRSSLFRHRGTDEGKGVVILAPATEKETERLKERKLVPREANV